MLVVVTVTKFAKGAWIVIAAMPFIVLFFWSVHRHYGHVAQALQARRLTGRDAASGTMLLLVPDLNLATRDAIAYLRAVRPTSLRALYVGREAYEATASAVAARGTADGDPRAARGSGQAPRARRAPLRAGVAAART